MMDMSMVSIIVPVYNAEPFLESCIESVMSQSFPGWELILVDDGSSDGSGHICEGYSLRDSRVRVIHKKNGGVTAARRDGTALSSSDWIMFLDADDTLKPDALEILWAHVDEADMINAGFISSSGRLWKHRKAGLLSTDEAVASVLSGETYGVVYSKLIKKTLLTDEVFSIPSEFRIGEDVLMNVIMARNAERILNIDDLIYEYRDNGSSVMNNYVGSVQYWDKYIDYRNSLLEERFIDRDRDRQILGRAFWTREIPFRREDYDLYRSKLQDRGLPFIVVVVLKQVCFCLYVLKRSVLGKREKKII